MPLTKAYRKAYFANGLHAATKSISPKALENGKKIHAALPEGVKRGYSNNPDVLWVGITQDVRNALLYKWKKLRPNIPIVLTHWWVPSTRRFARTVYKFAHQVSVCEWGREYLLKHHNMDSAVMYCPVDPDIFTLREEAPDPKRVLCIGHHFVSRDINGLGIPKTHHAKSL